MRAIITLLFVVLSLRGKGGVKLRNQVIISLTGFVLLLQIV